MVFYGLRKFARELGLEVQSGVVCGIYERYAVSMWEGNGYKTFSISAKFEEELCNKMEMELMELEANYRRVAYIRFIEGVLEARFVDNPGTMKQFRNCFFDVLSVLDEYEISDADICPKCGLPMYGQGVWSLFKLYGRKSCLYTHEHCAAAMEREVNRQLEIGKRTHISKEQFIKDIREVYPEESIEEIEKMYKEMEAENNPVKRYLPGWIGALGGGILGAIILGLAYALIDSHGFFLAIFLGAAIKAGYRITKDKQGKKSSMICIIMALIAAVLGVTLGYIFKNAVLINQFQTIPDGLSFIERCKAYVSSGFHTIILQKGEMLRYVFGALVYALIGSVDSIMNLFMDNGDKGMRRKRLQKRK